MLNLTTFLCLLAVSLISFGLTHLSLLLAKKWQIVDDPASAPGRKNQKKPVPLLGATGFSLFSSLGMAALWLTIRLPQIFPEFQEWQFLGQNWGQLSIFLEQNLFFPFHLFWILVAVLALLLAGFLDDKYQLPPKAYSFLVLLALLLATFLGGLKIEAFSYPFEQILPLGILPQSLRLLAGHLLACFWIGLCLTATKFLDGHDGLVSLVGLIALLSIASVATFPQVNQPLIFLFALIWAFSLVGFLPFNFPGARLYLGDGGSTVIGFIIGVLSILSGAKVATAGSVLGWFILDISLVMLTRIFSGQSISQGDSRLHWHHRLRSLGLQKHQVLAATCLILLFTAHTSLYFSTPQKLLVLLGQTLFLTLIFAFSFWRFKFPTSKKK